MSCVFAVIVITSRVRVFLESGTGEVMVYRIRVFGVVNPSI